MGQITGRLVALFVIGVAAAACAHQRGAGSGAEPLFKTVDLDLNRETTLSLAGGVRATVTLLAVEEVPDDVRGAIRRARASVRVNGETVSLSCGNYQLPIAAGGIQIDCPITQGYNARSGEAVWALERAARLRLWPAGSPWMPPGSFVYPVRQRWFASATQMANEPTFVDGGEVPNFQKKVYYHYGLDIGGAEGLVEVVSATSGVVVAIGESHLPGHDKTVVSWATDILTVQDERGWYIQYFHMKTREVSLGQQVQAGQRIGLLGKAGGSGGWAHLHFQIVSRKPSGAWGIEEGYAFLWEAYRREHGPAVVAVARPHHFAWTGEKITLDGSRSWAAAGPIARYDWTFGDGSTASGATVERSYAAPGIYSEILKVTDAAGRIAYDFAPVQILEKAHTDPLPPTIHAAYAPSLGLKTGDLVTFKVRAFRTGRAEAPWAGEVWDFGDGTPPVRVRSDGNRKGGAFDGYAETTHRYDRPGDYLVRVERAAPDGPPLVTRLHVQVGAK